MKNYFTKFEIGLWSSSVILVTLSAIIFRGTDVFSVIASLIGVTALIFCAKGNPIGQGLIIVFALMYGAISFAFAYYGEMITYMGMSLPMAVLSLISWLRNPYKGNKSQVKVNRIKLREVPLLVVLTVLVTALFYFILKALGTASLLASTLSVTTSFAAVYLTFRRSPFYAIAYALNDIVLLVLWSIAVAEDISYMSMIVCFAVFLANDTYSFINWIRMEKAQRE